MNKFGVLRGPDVEREGVSPACSRIAAKVGPVMPDLRSSAPADRDSSWTAKDLCRLVEARFGARYRESGMLKLLHSLGLSKQKTRPSHPKVDPSAQAAFKKTSKA